jgi:hypothetical protein
MMSATDCRKRKELEKDADSMLSELIRVIEAQRVALTDRNDKKVLALDKRLEIAFGAKERAFGALAQHKKEHGC